MSLRPLVELLAEHASVTQRLMEALTHRSESSAVELEHRVTAFFNAQSHAKSVTEADRFAQRAALQFSSERIRLEGEVDSYRAHLAHLELLIAHHGDITHAAPASTPISSD